MGDSAGLSLCQNRWSFYLSVSIEGAVELCWWRKRFVENSQFHENPLNVSMRYHPKSLIGL